MNRYCKIPFFVGLLFLSLVSWGQESQVEVQSLSVEDGLSNRWVNSITQTQDGYIWIGTNYGLNRYDGQEFKQYTSYSHQLQNDNVNRVHATSDDLLWLFYGNKSMGLDVVPNWLVRGIDLLDQKTDKLTPFENLFPNAGFSVKELAGTYLDEKAHLWLWTKKGKVYKYDGELKEIYRLEKEGRINALLKGRDGNLYVINDKNLLNVDPSGEILWKEKLSFLSEYLYEDKEGILWITELFELGESTSEEGAVKNTKRSPFLHYKKRGLPIEQYTFDLDQGAILNNKKDNYYTRADFDKADRIWAFEFGNIELIDPVNNWIYNFTEKQGLEPIGITTTCSFFDQNNVAFLGTDDGFYIINVEQNEITSIFKDIPENISARAILDYSADTLLICTYGNTYWYHKKTGALSPLPLLKGGSRFGGLIDSRGRVLLGTHGPYIEELELSKNKISRYDFKYPKEIVPAARKLFEDKQTKRIWVGLNKGLAYLEEEEKKLIDFEPGADFLDFNDHGVQCFYQKEKDLWLGTSNGLFLYQEGKGLVKKYMDFPNTNINYIHEDKEGIFWLSTLGGGLLRWDRGKEEVIQFTTNDGLSNNVIYASIEDQKGRLWLPSNIGLMCFDKQQFTTITYYPSDGLPQEEFNNVSYCQTREGLFYFGGIKGVVGFDPENLIFEKSKAVNLVITAFSKNDPETGRLVSALEDLRASETITINPNENAFVLNFAMLHFRGARQIKYRYKIEGIDSDWIFTDENAIRINRLPYGEYTLKLKGQGGGQWSSQELIIPIKVIKPYYKKVWFYLLLLLGLGSLIFLFVQWRIRFLQKEKEQLELEVQKRTEQINEQNQKLEALNATKDQFFGILAHDLRGPMLSFRGLSGKIRYLVEHNKEDRIGELSASVEMAYSKLENLLDNLLNWALMQKGALPYSPQEINLREAVEEVIELFEETASINNITLINEVSSKTLVFADANGLSSIIRNLVNNAIKFSGSGTSIIISSRKNKEKVICSVEDQGIGMSPEELKTLFDFNMQKRKIRKSGSKKGTGLGLVLCKELIDLHNGELEVESKEGKGTSILFSLPHEK